MCPGSLRAYQVLWFGGGATCTLMCMLVVVHICNTCQVSMAKCMYDYQNLKKEI